MAYFTSKPNHDSLFGHAFFQSAIDLSVIAKEKATVNARGVVPDYKEAKRLYEAAIRDAEAGIKEIESDDDWRIVRSGSVSHMKTQVSQWRGEIHSMP